MKIGAKVVVGRGTRKSSLAISLKRSTKIWKAPFRPIRMGPIRRMIKARTFRSPNATNNITSIYKTAVINDKSLTRSLI